MTSPAPSRSSRSALPPLLPTGTRVFRSAHVSIVLRNRPILLVSVLFLVAAAIGVFSLTVGSYRVSSAEVIQTLLGNAALEQHEKVILGLRLPRVVTSLFAGAALGVSGAVFQSVSRNALGSPDVIGFTTGAATGAIVQIVVFQASPLVIAVSAVAGGIVTAALVYLLSMQGRVSGGYRLVLVGIGVGAVLGAVNDLLLVIGELDNAVAANLWRSGSLDARNWGHALPVMLGAICLIPVIAWLSRRAAMIEMGDDMATQLGVRVEPVRAGLMFAAVALAGLATGAAGPIAFIALAAPQLAARLTRTQHMPVLGAAAMGALLLTAADVLTQLLPITASVPIGRMTGLLGGMYLIWLLTRSKQV